MLRGNRLILFVAFVLVLAAGVVLGQLWWRLPVQFNPQSPARSWLADQLRLNPEQHKQMDAIWSEARKDIGRLNQARREFETEHKQAIDHLLTPSQKMEYDRLNRLYQKQRETLESQRRELIQKAETSSRALLSPEQQTTWDKMTRQWRHRHHGSTTHPSTQEITRVPEHAE